MSVKIFSFKGLNGVLTVLSIVIPVATWLVDRFWKKDYEPVMYDAAGNAEKKTMEKAA